MNIGVLASHNGTTLQSIIDACEAGQLAAELKVVISNNSQSGALQRAQKHQLNHCHLSSKQFPDTEALDRALRETLEQYDVEWIVLAGYMKKLGPETLTRFRGRVLNTHPSLLPKFGGQGMYGGRVHQAVLDAGESQTGVSIHLVDGDYDTGPIVAQCEVAVEPNDTAESLARRVQSQERRLLVETLQAIATGQLEGIGD